MKLKCLICAIAQNGHGDEREELMSLLHDGQLSLGKKWLNVEKYFKLTYMINRPNTEQGRGFDNEIQDYICPATWITSRQHITLHKDKANFFLDRDTNFHNSEWHLLNCARFMHPWRSKNSVPNTTKEVTQWRCTTRSRFNFGRWSILHPD